MSELKTTAPPAAGKVDKANDPEYILNPKTNRYVKRRGVVGRKMKREMSRKEIVDHVRRQATDAALANRNLMASNLSDGELLAILRKVIDIKLDESLNVDDAIPAKPKLVRQVGEGKARHAAKAPPPPPPSPKKSKRSKKAKQSKKSKAPKSTARRRFKVLTPPPPDTETDFTEIDDTTAYEQTDVGYTEASESSSSESE